MNEGKMQRVYRTVMLIMIVATITYVITTMLVYDKEKKYTISTNDNMDMIEKIESSVGTVKKILDEKYIGDINENDLVEGAVKGMVEGIGDVYTEYFTKEEYESFTASTIGNFVGIGVYMQANLENGLVEIVEPIENSPAERAGLKSGDKILKVNGVEYTAAELDKLASAVKGEEGTEVELTILRDEEEMEFSIVRESIHVNYVSEEMLDDEIGYISLESFDDDCCNDFLKAYNELIEDGMKYLVLDLRNNGGGLVDEALEIADLFCDKGNTTLITVDKNGEQEITKAKKNPTITIPVVLIVNQYSASATELLAAALKDNGKAEIVGTQTYGKGVIQELIPLSNGGAIKVTTSEYYTPNGEKINKIGVEPDYEIENVDEQLMKAQEILKNK